MTDSSSYETEINKTVNINASVSKVWDAMTNPALIKLWMSDSAIDVISEWQVGSPIIFRGDLHWISFENKGTIRQFDPEKVFQYNYWSSLSNLPDIPENYTEVRFVLTPIEDKTMVILTLNNFPDEIIYKHVNFYWNVTLAILKKLCEQL